MEDIQNAINSLEITLIRHGDEGLITDLFSANTLKLAIKALKQQIGEATKEKKITINYLNMCKSDLLKIKSWMKNKQSDISVLESKIKAIDFILEELLEID